MKNILSEITLTDEFAQKLGRNYTKEEYLSFTVRIESEFSFGKPDVFKPQTRRFDSSFTDFFTPWEYLLKEDGSIEQFDTLDKANRFLEYYLNGSQPIIKYYNFKL